MIGKLKGVIDAAGQDFVIIDVGGVGYEVSCSPRTLASLPAAGQTVTLAIETHVREDCIKLFGFASEMERSWFRLLQTVQGVGTKVALAILGTLGAEALAHAIALQDKAQIARTPGVGPKVAQRVITELKDKAPSLLAGGALHIAAMPGQAASIAASPAADAVSALTNLGYAPAQANAAVAAVMGKAGEAARAEDLIRLGLKELAR